MSKITFLGTGTSQGIPMIGCNCEVCKSKDIKDKRLRTSAFIEENGFKILIDCGPDFRQQMLRENITDIDAVILTHNHKDHTGGLDDIRAFNYFKHKAFPIYSEKYVQDSLKMEYSYAFSEYKYPGVPEYDLKTITNAPFTISKLNEQGKEIYLTITPIRVYHHKLAILGFRIGKLAYITDGNYIPEEEFEKLKDLNVFVINTVRKEKHISHFSLSEALEIIEKVNAKKSYLTHLSHQIGTNNQLIKELPKNVKPAYDRLTVEF